MPVQPSDRFTHLVGLAGRVFVSDFQSIETCAGTSCASLTVFADPSITHLDITGLASDGVTLFWTSDTKLLLACAVGATCTTPTAVVGSASIEGAVPIALSIHGADLYVVTDAGTLFTCVASSCTTTFHRLATDELIVGMAAADDTAVYWLGGSRTVEAGTAQAFRLMRVAK